MRTKSIIFYSTVLTILLQGCTKTVNENLSFTKHIVHDTFISEGVTVGDVNNDGLTDILAGAFWFEAPNWKAHEIKKPKFFDYTKGYSDSFLNFSMDVNFDGWIDFIVVGFPGKEAYWYENPKNIKGHWKEHLIDSNACNESPMFVDIDGNGRKDLVFGNESTKTMIWLKSPDTAGDLEWKAIPISKKEAPGTKRFSHGLGFGDVNDDGRNDIIVTEGWWESPKDRNEIPWKFHKANLGEPSAQMYAYDLDLDQKNDIISSSAHAYGIWWHKNKSSDQLTNFTHHKIDSTFSQTHGIAFKDLNGDKLPDLITGKRFFAHQGKDPGGLEPAVLYWFELQRDENNAPFWNRHLIDDDSGVGLQVVIEDLNNDGKLDIINSNKKGVIYFLQE